MDDNRTVTRDAIQGDAPAISREETVDIVGCHLGRRSLGLGKGKPSGGVGCGEVALVVLAGVPSRTGESGVLALGRTSPPEMPPGADQHRGDRAMRPARAHARDRGGHVFHLTESSTRE
ncbi:hypothetical protein Lesp02_14740 [Lentzea sp. NBRC 105346]|nr:hypothetical protein Lesp02_14740 [Lentzea sp. NBRC 105346]